MQKDAWIPLIKIQKSMQSKQNNSSVLSRKLSKVLVGALLILVLFGIGYFAFPKNTPTNENEFKSNKLTAKIYKSPNCGCCLEHGNYLDGEGFDVEMNVVNDVEAVKEKHNIPYDMQSCHTTEIEGYFVEGHVPIAAINKLLTEKPDVDGISLPDMPAGSPGMPGVKKEEFVIYSLKDGRSEVFMKI